MNLQAVLIKVRAESVKQELGRGEAEVGPDTRGFTLASVIHAFSLTTYGILSFFHSSHNR